MTFVLIVAIFILLITYIINQCKKPRNYPPGPSWIPFVGNLTELKKLSRSLGGQHLALIELAKKYNTNVLGLKLGKDFVVTVFSYPVVRTVLTGEEYDGRPDNFFIRLRTMETKKGITCTDGEHWKIQRNFVMTHLRNLGFGKKTMEFMIKEEISEILELLENDNNIDHIGTLLAPAVLNILWSLTTGSRFSRKDVRLSHLLELMNSRSKAFDVSGGILNYYPWLRFFAPERTGYNLIKHLNDELKTLFSETVTEHHKTWIHGREDDLIYSFITKMKQDNGHKTTFTEEQLIMVCLDLFIGGSQTTSTTLDFAFLMMILYPDIQRKVHDYLDIQFSTSEEVNYCDRLRVPYIEAVLLEVQRYCNIVPTSGPRRVLQNTVLEGYFIPKNTTVLISLYSVHHDKSYWKDPEHFRPERFLDDNGELLAHERLIPFGLGKRRCLAEILARNCIFLFFVEIMRKYEISTKPGTERPTGKCSSGLTLSPERYNARFTKRK